MSGSELVAEPETDGVSSADDSTPDEPVDAGIVAVSDSERVTDAESVDEARVDELEYSLEEVVNWLVMDPVCVEVPEDSCVEVLEAVWVVVVEVDVVAGAS